MRTLWHSFTAGPLHSALGLLSGAALTACSPPPSSAPEAVLGEAELAATTCVTIQRGAGGTVDDTYLHGGLPAVNFGDSTDLYAGIHPSTGGVQRALIRFDLSSIPVGSTITSADLTVTVGYTAATTEQVRIRRVTSAWGEGAATWSTHGNAYDASALHGSFTAGAGARTTSITGLVQAWVSGAHANHGLVLEQTANRTPFKSSEASQAQRPQLMVCYEPGAGGGSGSGGGGGGGSGGGSGSGGGGGGSVLADAGISSTGARVTYGCEPGGAIAGATYYFVDAAAAPGGNGARGAPFTTVQAAYLAIQNGQRAVLCIAQGTYPEFVGSSADRFAAQTEYTLVGGFQPGSGFAVRDSLAYPATIQAPDTSAAALTFGNVKAVTVDGLRLTGGRHGLLIASGYSTGRSVTIKNSHVVANGVEGLSGHTGGGLRLSAGQILVEHNVIEDNRAGAGGAGIFIASPSSAERNSKSGGVLTVVPALATIRRNIVRGNVARHDTPHGAGISISMNALVDHNIIEGNRGLPLLSGSGGAGVGGGLIVQHPYVTATIEHNWVAGNVAEKAGAGLFIDEASIGTLVNNVIAGNQGRGAICVDGRAAGSGAEDRGYATIVNNTVTGNTDGAIYLQDATVAAYNNVFWSNGSSEITFSAGGPIPEDITLDHNLLSSGCAGPGACLLGPHNQIGAAPLFADAAAGDYQLAALSPALDLGTSSFTPAFVHSGALTAAPAVDHDEVPRPQGAGVDAGALERAP